MRSTCTPDRSLLLLLRRLEENDGCCSDRVLTLCVCLVSPALISCLATGLHVYCCYCCSCPRSLVHDDVAACRDVVFNEPQVTRAYHPVNPCLPDVGSISVSHMPLISLLPFVSSAITTITHKLCLTLPSHATVTSEGRDGMCPECSVLLWLKSIREVPGEAVKKRMMNAHIALNSCVILFMDQLFSSLYWQFLLLLPVTDRCHL